MQAVFDHGLVSALLKDRRLGREKRHLKTDSQASCALLRRGGAFDAGIGATAAYEAPGLVLRAFTSRRIGLRRILKALRTT